MRRRGQPDKDGKGVLPAELGGGRHRGVTRRWGERCPPACLPASRALASRGGGGGSPTCVVQPPHSKATRAHRGAPQRLLRHPCAYRAPASRLWLCVRSLGKPPPPPGHASLIKKLPTPGRSKRRSDVLLSRGRLVTVDDQPMVALADMLVGYSLWLLPPRNGFRGLCARVRGRPLPAALGQDCSGEPPPRPVPPAAGPARLPQR